MHFNIFLILGRNSCTVCHRTFKRCYDLARHMKEQHNPNQDNLFKCDICNKITKRAHDLKRHMITRHLNK